MVGRRELSAPLGEWPEMVCAENPNEYFHGRRAAVPTADRPDFDQAGRDRLRSKGRERRHHRIGLAYRKRSWPASGNVSR
jgi:hypothetical protein